MKPTLKPFTGILAVLLLLPACTSIFINEISKSPNFNLNTEHSKTALVAGLEGVQLNEFVKTFNKKYQKQNDFVVDYTKLFTAKLRSEKIFTQVKADTSGQWNIIKSFATVQDDFKAIDSLFNHSTEDYLICLSDLEISNRFQTVTVGGGPNMPPSTSSVEYCVIKARFQIFELKTRQKLMEFFATGESQVFLFAFESAFISAMNSSMYHALAYLKTGKKEF